MIKDLNDIKKQISFDKLQNKKVLLIGSNGFLGNWFKDFFEYFQIEYMTYDIQDNKEHDICKPIELPRYDYVINCAGIASPEKYMKKPIETMDVSYLGTKNVLEYCRKNNVESVLFFSSSEVYGTPNKNSIPTKESYIGSIPTRGSRSCYDIGKQALETLCFIYHNEYKMPIKVVRPFNFYGPYMGINDNRVLSNWMRCFINQEELMIYGDGEQTRTFCYAADGIAMCLAVLLEGEQGEVYNVGNPTPELSMLELAKIFCSSLNHSSGYVVRDYPNHYPSDEPLRRCPNIDKVVKQTGASPYTTLNTGLKKMLTYFEENES